MVNLQKTEKGLETAYKSRAELERIKEELRESENNYQLLFDNVNAGIVRISKYGRITDINSKVEEYFGYKRKELIGKHFTRLGVLTMKDLPKLVSMFKNIMTGKVTGFRSEVEATDKQGNKIVVDVNSAIVKKDGKIEGTISIIYDITQRKKVEETLKESEEKFSRIFSCSPVGLSLTRLSDGVVLEINESYTKFTGYTRNEIIGRNIKELNIWINPEDRDRMLKIMKEKGRVTNEEFSLHVKSGEARPVLISAENISIKGEDCLLIMAIDIFDRKQTEIALRESEKKYAGLVEHGNDGILILQDNVIKYINTKLQEISGYSYEEVIGKQFISVVAEEFRESVIARSRKKLAGEEVPPKYEFDIINKSGERVSVEVNTSQMEFEGRPADMAIVRDVTERKQAEEQLKESEEFNSTLLTNTPNAIFVTYPDGAIKYVNPAFEKLTGFSLAEIIGIKTPYPWWLRDKKDEIEASLKETAPGKGINLGERLSKQMTFQKKNAELFTVELNATVINKAGQQEYILVTWNDITERKRAEEQLKESEEFNSSLLTNTPNPILVTHPDSAIKYVNPAFEKLTGFTLYEIIGVKTPYPWWPRESIKEIDTALKKAGLGQNNKIEMTYKKKSGESFWIELNITSIAKDGKQKYRLINWVDITERKKAEESLRFSDAAFKSIHEAVIAMDTQNIITYWNSISEELFGIKAPQAIGNNYFNVIKLAQKTPEQIGGVFGKFKKQGYIRDEILFITPHGNLWADTAIQAIMQDGKQCGYVVTALDITERKQSEEALRKSEENFRRSLDESPLGVRIVNSDDETIYANRTLLDIYGYASIEELKSIPVEKHFTPEMYKEFQLRKSKRNWGKPQSERIETSIIRKDGEIRHLENLRKEVLWNGEKQYQVLHQDITERKQAENALKESEEKFSKAFNSASNAMAIILYNRGIFLEVNDGYLQISGYSREELIGRNADDLNMWGNQEDRLRILRKTKQEGRVFQEEHSFRTKSGNIRNCLFSSESFYIGGEQRMIINVQDITERKQAEDALKDSEEKFSKAFSSTANAICIITLADGKFLEINEGYSRFTGYSREETIGHTADELKLWVNPEEYQRVQISAENKGTFSNVEFQSRMKSGEIRVGLSSTEVINIGGKECRIVVITDITDRIKVQHALKESEEKFSKAFNSSGNAISITNLADNKFLEINEAYTRFTGYTREEAIGHTAAELKLWANPEEWKQVSQTAVKDGLFINFEFHSRMKSGEIRIGLSSSEEINIGGKKCRITVITDITERKKAEDALKESEEKFSKAFSSSGNAICITNLEDNKFLEINEAYTRFTGYTREEAIGHTADELKLWAYPEELEQMLAILDKDENFSDIEFHSRMKSGEIRVGLSSAQLITINSKKCRIVVIADITKRKKAEDALKESEDKFSKAFNSSTNAICITTLKDNHLVEINESFTRFTGYTYQEVIGRSASELNLWVKPDELKIWTDTLLKEGRVFNQEFSSRKKTGEVRIGLASAEIINIKGEPCRIVVITDISERKKAEEDLKISEENFRHTLNDSPLGIRIVDTTGKTIHVNQALLEIYGYTCYEEFMSINVENRFTPESYKKHLSLLHNMVKGESLPRRGETSIVRKDGEIRNLEILRKEVLWNGEKQSQLLYQDITERKLAEANLKQALANLEQSNSRLEGANKELEAFSYSVSHDLRSPLRSIDGFSQAILEDYASKLDATGQDYLNRLRSASQKMGELIDGLLRLSRLSRSELHKKTIDLSALADEIATRLRETNPERKAEFIIGSGLTANADPQLLRALLENLLGNAWKFTGKVPLAIIEFGAVQNSSPRTFFVKDNGAGFDMTYVDKLFGAFQRLHDTADFPGTGIGLATVRRIINRHGGTVRAEGTVGKGAAFYFTLG